MKMRLLNNGDFSFGHGLSSYAKDNAAIMENIQTRLLCFFGDSWNNRMFGLDWLRLLGTPGTQQEIELSIKAMILKSYGVTKLNSLTATINPYNRRALIITGNINTLFTQNYIFTTQGVF